ncbi:MAG: hypothetical protein WCG13_00030 [Burkholderiales bacterium]
MSPESQTLQSNHSTTAPHQFSAAARPALAAANSGPSAASFTDTSVDPGVVDLFCALAENSPELLPARWSTLFDVIAAEEKFWVYPSATVGEIEDFGEAAFVPFLRRSALIKEWPQLLEHARRVDACRETGRAWGYTC